MHILLYGQIMLWAVFELLVVPMIWKGYSLSALLPAVEIVFAASIVAGILWGRKKKKRMEQDKTENGNTAFIVQENLTAEVLTMALTVMLILLYLFLNFQAKGDAAYMASITDSWQTGRLLHLDPLSGNEMMYLSRKTIASAFPVWEVWLCGITRLHPLVLCHLILPVFFVPLSVTAWRELAAELFPQKEKAAWAGPILLAVWIAAACMGKGNSLFPLWQGEHVAALIVFPVFLRLILSKDGGIYRAAYRRGLTMICVKLVVLLALLLCSWKAAAAGIIVWIGVFLIRLLEGKQDEQA